MLGLGLDDIESSVVFDILALDVEMDASGQRDFGLSTCALCRGCKGEKEGSEEGRSLHDWGEALGRRAGSIEAVRENGPNKPVKGRTVHCGCIWAPGSFLNEDESEEVTQSCRETLSLDHGDSSGKLGNALDSVLTSTTTNPLDSKADQAQKEALANAGGRKAFIPDFEFLTGFRDADCRTEKASIATCAAGFGR